MVISWSKITRICQEDVLLLYPFKEGSKYIAYDEASHRATIVDDRTRAHAASYSNASRVTTYLRGAVEQFHGGLKGTFKVIFNTYFNLKGFKYQVLNGMPASYFAPIGQEMLAHYNGLFECDWTMEWAGYSIAYLVFVCSVSLYNYGHPKFLRTAPDALQVRFECSINLILRKYILLNRSRLLTEFFGCSHDIRFWWMIRCSGQ